mgnify:FL=1|jgi:hypothetical protein
MKADLRKYTSLLLAAVKRIEAERPGVIAWASRQERWWELCVSDYDLYRSEEFARIKKTYRQALAVSGGGKLIFCYTKPDAERLYELELKGNLVMDC